ncbi:hypothetical protein E0Z10_g8115 [Xylaria hypoxylon]|uniref:2EXR domain-containing protein n=1 Tax=Xylaria hypoxylon TaxID=37992 RepID=A0A4Z0Y918_9PEZI|nr:hypothetical protein E0Z10_g8115 [Xylaria hypoxylon]
MAYQGNKAEFINFNLLAPELRQLIWKESVLTAMDNPEVLILVSGRIRASMYGADNSSPFPRVNIGFPTAMHVNREARDIALLYLKNMAGLRPYPWSKCPISQRPFRPEIDTLYASRSFHPDEDFSKEDIAKVQHLALDLGDDIVSDIIYFFTYSFKYMPALRTLRLVLPVVQNLIFLNSKAPPLPHRRCMLRPIGAENLGRVTVCSTTVEAQLDEAAFYWPNLERNLLGMWPAIDPKYPRVFQVTLSEAVQIIQMVAWEAMSTILVLSDRDAEMVRAVRTAKAGITFEACHITEWCYSPFGRSTFVAAGERFPDSPHPSVFSTLPSSERAIQRAILRPAKG